MQAKEVIEKAEEIIKQSSISEDDKKLMKMALEFHGHVCPAMPAGFRAGRMALRLLGLERERNSVARVFVEVGTHQAAGCFADGLQCATGCTYGKDNIHKMFYGKWAFVLVGKDNRAVRVSLKPEVMEKNFGSPFLAARKQGILPSEVDPEIALKIFTGTLARAEEEIFNAGSIFTWQDTERKIATCFAAKRCDNCGELVAENYLRYKEGQTLCIPCSGY